jgi:SAM-dependent methyltransferase
MDIQGISDKLHFKNGIHYSSERSKVSYPEGAHSGCFQLESESFWFKHRNRCIVELMKQYPPQGAVFDIGGGNGFVTRGILDAGFDAVLMEPGEEGCLNAQERGLDRIFCATLTDSEIPEESIPAMGFFDVVEHIEDDKSFLREAHRHLLPGGRIYLTVPAYAFLWSNEDIGAGHYRRYTRQGLEKLLLDCGFKPLFSSYIFSFLPPAIFLFRSLPSKLGRNKNAYELQKYRKEHGERKGSLGRLMEKLFAIELSRIRKGQRIPFGSTVLLAAEKTSSRS